MIVTAGLLTKIPFFQGSRDPRLEMWESIEAQRDEENVRSAERRTHERGEILRQETTQFFTQHNII